MTALDFSLEFMLGEYPDGWGSIPNVERELIANAIQEMPFDQQRQWVSQFKIPLKRVWVSVDVELKETSGIDDAVEAIQQAIKTHDFDEDNLVIWGTKFINNVTGDYFPLNN